MSSKELSRGRCIDMHAFPNTELDINFEDKLDESELTSKTWNLRYNHGNVSEAEGLQKALKSPVDLEGAGEYRGQLLYSELRNYFQMQQFHFFLFPTLCSSNIMRFMLR